MPRLAALLAVFCLIGIAAGAQTAAEAPFRRAEVLMEGGLAVPLGDLAASYESTERGMGAELGYALGLRLRIYVSRTLSLAPAFAYVEFGDYDGYDAEEVPFKIRTSVLRYGLDFLYLAPGGEGSFRPCLGAGVAAVRNKYHQEIRADDTVYDAARNAFAWSVQAGVRLQDWELVLQYESNRFTTPAFDASGEDQDFNWSNLVVRVGYVLPRL